MASFRATTPVPALSLVFVLALASGPLAADAPAPSRSEPQIASHRPLGGGRGTTFEVRARGKALEGAYAVWFQCDDVRGAVKTIETVEPEPPPETPRKRAAEAPARKEPEYQVTVEVEASARAAPGFHVFRIVTPRGASNARALEVAAEPVAGEQPGPHASAAAAQRLSPPQIVNGLLGAKGELDFYAIDVVAGSELRFEAVSDFKMDVPYRAQVELEIWEPTGSWFDPDRLTRLPASGPVMSWEPIHAVKRHDFAAEFKLFPMRTQRFEHAGRFYVSVGAFLGRGGPSYGYQLRVAPAAGPSAAAVPLGTAAHRDPADWLERDSATMRQFGSFTRPLEVDRAALLARRSVEPYTRAEPAKPYDPAATLGADDAAPRPESAPPPLPPPGPARILREVEPNDTEAGAVSLTLPVIVEGAIDRPGDVDLFKLRARAGEQVALEVETPQAHPPNFNPWLHVRGADGRELVANIYKEYGGDGDDPNKTLERKTVFTLEAAGDYTVEVRNLVPRDGGPDFVYRLLARPQIPHVGRIELSLGVVQQGSQITDVTDRMNLPRGESRKLTLLVEKEEGYDGDVAVTAENLPPGVSILPSSPASWTEVLLRGMQYRPVGVELMPADHHRPHREVLTLLVEARPEAPVCRVPQMVRFTAWPVVAGRRGQPIPAGEAAIMVTGAAAPAPASR